jgi:hypothetical protein
MRQFLEQKIEAITLNVICETPDGRWTEALTDNYLKINLAGRLDANQWVTANVSTMNGDTLLGSILAIEAANRPAA